MESKKYNKVDIPKKNIESKLVITSGEREGKRDNTGIEDQEVQTIMHKIRIYCTRWGI